MLSEAKHLKPFLFDGQTNDQRFFASLRMTRSEAYYATAAIIFSLDRLAPIRYSNDHRLAGCWQ